MLGESSANVGHAWLYIFGHMTKTSVQKCLLFSLLSQFVLVLVKSIDIVFCVIFLMFNFLEVLFLLHFKYLVIMNFSGVLIFVSLLPFIFLSDLSSLGVLHAILVYFLKLHALVPVL